jgi:heparosan-N-sulfate-glucuronate 5-epimerase
MVVSKSRYLRGMDTIFNRLCGTDFWHGKRSIGSYIRDKELWGYYADLTAKTSSNRLSKSDLGIPLLWVKSRNAYALHPVTVCQAALGWHDRWIGSQKDGDLIEFKRLSQWLLDNREQRRGVGTVWASPFAYPIYQLKSGWVSALVQGQALSVLVRAYRIWGKQQYIDVASEALAVLTVPKESGGVLYVDPSNGIVFEEYPTKQRNCVLNGFISALWGVYDFARITSDQFAHDLFLRGKDSLVKHLPQYDTGYWSRYCLADIKRLSNLASPYYHQEHVSQLDAMFILTGDGAFREYSRKWMRYSRNICSVTRVVAMKVVSRVRTRSESL